MGVRMWLCGGALALACAAGFAQPPEAAGKPTPEESAVVLWQAGYLMQVLGRYERAIEYYRSSIALHPSAEAHTYLGWALSHLGRLEEAIAECKTAIGLDPDFGNPYNDIGVYLIGLGKMEEAVPWLTKAIAARRYCCYQFPHFNLGRVLLAQGKVGEAQRSFERALEHDPDYLPAREALEEIRRRTLKGT